MGKLGISILRCVSARHRYNGMGILVPMLFALMGRFWMCIRIAVNVRIQLIGMG
jgi:hypothetical protein